MTNDLPRWPDELYDTLKAHDVRQVACVPDAGHSRLIQRFEDDAEVRLVRLTTEEEGVSLLAGAWLGGQRGVMLIQSSGVGNCINMLALTQDGRFPFVMIVTMRGDEGEFNAMQVPMGHATPTVLEAMGVIVKRARSADEVVPTVDSAMSMAYNANRAVAVLINQSIIGAKDFRKLTEAGAQE